MGSIGLMNWRMYDLREASLYLFLPRYETSLLRIGGVRAQRRRRTDALYTGSLGRKYVASVKRDVVEINIGCENESPIYKIITTAFSAWRGVEMTQKKRLVRRCWN